MLALLLFACSGPIEAEKPADDDPDPDSGTDSAPGETDEPLPAPELGGRWLRLEGLRAGRLTPLGRAAGADWLDAATYGDEPRRLVRVDGPGAYTAVDFDAEMAARARVDELLGDDVLHWVTADEGIYTSEDGVTWTAMRLPWTDGDDFDETGTGTLSTIRQALWHAGALHVVRHVTTYTRWAPLESALELRVLRGDTWSTLALPSTSLWLSSDGATLYGTSSRALCVLGEAWSCVEAGLPSAAELFTLGGVRVAVGSDGVAALVDGVWTKLVEGEIDEPVLHEGALWFFAGGRTGEPGVLTRLGADLGVTERGGPAARCSAAGKRLAQVGGELFLSCQEGAWGLEYGRWVSRSPYGRAITSVTAGDAGVWVAGDGLLYRLQADWTEVTIPDLGWGTGEVVDPATVQVVRATDEDAWIGAGHGRLWKSEGDGFEVVLEGDPGTYVTDVAAGDEVYAAFWGYTAINHGDGSEWAVGGGLYRRDEYGWTPVHEGLPPREIAGADMGGPGAAVVSHVYADDDVLLAATQAGVAISHDAGERWALPDLPRWDAEAERTRTARVGDRLVLARQAPAGLALYASDDDGDTWEALSPDLPDGVTLGDLAIYDGHLLLGSASGGAWASDDGVAWAVVAELDVAVHALTPAPGGLLAGTVDGVWRWSR